MADEGENFAARWSRLKRVARAEPPAPAEAPRQALPQAPAAPLPPVESLTPQSDFTAFMADKVESGLRRAALKKLFADPRFNVADPFEAYSGDWTGGEAIPDEMLKSLNQARTVLFREEEEAKRAAEEAAAQAGAGGEAPQAPGGEAAPGKQDA